MTKPHTAKTPEQLFQEATEGKDLSQGDLRLLTSGLTALRKAYEKPLNTIELTALLGMIGYVAYIQRIDETIVKEILIARYGAADIKFLPSRHYQGAMEFLMELETKRIVN